MFLVLTMIPIPTQYNGTFISGFTCMEANLEWLLYFIDKYSSDVNNLEVYSDENRTNKNPLTAPILMQRAYTREDYNDDCLVCNKIIIPKSRELIIGKTVKLYNAFDTYTGIQSWNTQYDATDFQH